jgi:hypothetical protein
VDLQGGEAEAVAQAVGEEVREAAVQDIAVLVDGYGGVFDEGARALLESCQGEDRELEVQVDVVFAVEYGKSFAVDLLVHAEELWDQRVLGWEGDTLVSLDVDVNSFYGV